jgi:hypothetical protein
MFKTTNIYSMYIMCDLHKHIIQTYTHTDIHTQFSPTGMNEKIGRV